MKLRKKKRERQRGKKLEAKNDCCFSTMIKKIFDIYNYNYLVEMKFFVFFLSKKKKRNRHVIDSLE